MCGGICPECGKPMQNRNRNDLETYMTIDHIVPKAQGGTDNIENLRPLCRACNNKRGMKQITTLAFRDRYGHWISC